MTVIRIRARVPEDRRLVIELPADTPVGDAEVEVRVEAEREPNGAKVHAALEEIWARQRQDPNFRPRTKEEIDAYLQEERDSWD